MIGRVDGVRVIRRCRTHHCPPHGVISFTDRPLRAALNLGFGAIVVAFGVPLYGLVQHWRGETVRGWTSIMVTMLFLGGVHSSRSRSSAST